MILPIKKYPDPLLRKKCLPVQILRSKTWSGEEVQGLTEEIKKLTFDMLETMTASQGIGLAAPQVGELKRVIVVQSEKNPQVFINLPSASEGEKRGFALFDPKITKKSRETITDEEGCLSFPGLFLKIKRAKKVEIEALLAEASPHLAPRSSSLREANEKEEKSSLKKVSFKAEGLPARVFQHEIDHLNGILFIDRLSFWQKLKIRKTLKFTQVRPVSEIIQLYTGQTCVRL